MKAIFKTREKSWVHYLTQPTPGRWQPLSRIAVELAQYYASRMDTPVTVEYKPHGGKASCNDCHSDGWHRETFNPLPDIFSM